MKYILITVGDSDEVRAIVDILAEAEEEGELDFAFNIQSFNSPNSVLVQVDAMTDDTKAA